MPSSSNRRFIPGYQGIAPVLIGLLFSVTLLSIVFVHLRGNQFYPDVVAGYVAFWGLDKSQDFKAFGLVLALLFSLPVALSALTGYVAPGGHRSALGRAVHQLLLYSLIPAAWRLAVDCALPVAQIPQFEIVCLFPGLALISLLMLSRYRRALTPDQVLISGGGVVLFVVFSAFAGLALGVFCVRLIPGAHRVLGNHGDVLCTTGAVIALLLAIWVCVVSRTADLFQQRVLKCLEYCQYALPLFLFHLVPPPFLDPKHRFNEHFPTLLVLVLAALVGLSWWLMRRRFRAVPQAVSGSGLHQFALSRAIAPAALVGLMIFVYCRAATIPAIELDDFHWGEQALPWQQLIHFHKIPYIDFVPIHGLMSYIRGAFDSLFFDGTAASWEPADLLLKGIASAALTLAVCSVVGPLGALYLFGGSIYVFDRLYFYIPALLAIAAPKLREKPVRLVIAWIAITALMVGYNPTSGPAFAVATLPVGLWAIYRAWGAQRRALMLVFLVVFAMIAPVVAIPLARHIARAFVQFITDNGYTNIVAHGLPWSEGMHYHDVLTGPGSTQFLFELIRWFWVMLIFICGMLFWRFAIGGRENRDRTRSSRVSLLIVCASIPPYLILWSPWLLTRIMPSTYAYQGNVSQTCLFWLVPALVILALSRRRLAGALLVLAAVTGFFHPQNPTEVDPHTLCVKSVVVRETPDDFPLTDGAKIGMPLLGRVVTYPNMKYLLPIHDFLHRFLKPGETFADLTNHTAIYYYLDLPYPTRYVPFVAANSRMQAEQLQQLTEHPVPAALLSPNIMMDQLSPTIRDYRVFRRYATTYSMVTLPDCAFLVDPVRGAQLVPPAIPNGTPEFIKELDSACYFMGYLYRLPTSWGHSWKSLQPYFTHVADVDPGSPITMNDLTVRDNGVMVPKGRSVYLEYAVPPQAASGSQADFLLMHFTGTLVHPVPKDAPPNDPRFQFSFTSRSMGLCQRPFSFDAASGDLLIPLGAYPRWLLLKDLISIRLDLYNPEQTRSFRFTKMEFLHLND